MIRSIIQLGNPILRQLSSEVSTEELRSNQISLLIEDLRDTLHDFQQRHQTGRGIAAPQIGINKRVIYIETSEFKNTLINPRYLYKSKQLIPVWDSCFSYWGISFQVLRHRHVEIAYLSESGEHMSLKASDGLSELLQHEIEHLDGQAAIDQLIPAGLICTPQEQALLP